MLYIRLEWFYNEISRIKKAALGKWRKKAFLMSDPDTLWQKEVYSRCGTGTFPLGDSWK